MAHDTPAPQHQHFDVFILGGGPAGTTLAEGCRAGGLTVGIAEPRGFSGTCGLRGCDPKRVMATVAEAVDNADRLAGKGVSGDVSVDWRALCRFVREGFLDGKPARARAALEEQGIATFTEAACFTGQRTLKVGDALVEADHIVVATGQHPTPLDIPGGEHALTSADFHDVEELPARIVFVGGGYIGLESAHIAARAGAHVTIFNNDADPLPMFEGAFAQRLLDATRALGVEVHLETAAQRIEPTDKGFRVSVKGEGGATSTHTADIVFNTAGRTPTLEGLDLEAAGVETSEAGIPVDEFYRTRGGNPHVYAIGDVADSDGPPLTPVAELEARALIETIVRGRPTAADYSGLPTVVYTLPELAMVGLTEEEARGRGHEVEVHERLDADDKYNGRRTNARAYGYKTITDAATGKLLGAHLIGPRVSEVINVYALAIRGGLPASLLHETPWAYPTWGSDISGQV